MELVRRATETGSEYVLHEGNWIRIDTDQGEQFEATIGELRNDEGVIKIPAGAMLDIFENLELLEFVDLRSIPKPDDLLPDDLPQIEQPEKFKGQLFPYQLAGYQWLHRISNHLIGGLLADDMGLGKTVQVIAHLLKLKEGGVSGSHLIVVPKTLMENWQREIYNFTGGALL